MLQRKSGSWRKAVHSVPEGVLCSLCFVYIRGMLTKLLALILDLIVLFGFAAVSRWPFTLPACNSSQNYILQQQITPQ